MRVKFIAFDKRPIGAFLLLHECLNVDLEV